MGVRCSLLVAAPLFWDSMLRATMIDLEEQGWADRKWDSKTPLFFRGWEMRHVYRTPQTNQTAELWRKQAWNLLQSDRHRATGDVRLHAAPLGLGSLRKHFL